MAQQLLQPNERDPRLGAVHPEGVPEIVDRDVGSRFSRGVPPAILELRRERGRLEEPAGAAVVVEGRVDA